MIVHGVCTVVLLITTGCATRNSTIHSFMLQPGDLLFQDLDAGPLCVAIEKVTVGVNCGNFSHAGMVTRSGEDGVWIVEAVGAGVVETSLDAFLARSKDSQGRPKVVVGRLKSPFDSLIPLAIEQATLRIGKPYDGVYTMEQDAFYCSELLYTCFREANGGREVFLLFPMTFNDPDTGQPFPAWVNYYENLGVPIPEGEPGLNPGGISRSPVLDIVHVYGRPDGWRSPFPQD